jgi:hypothetical protein
MVQKIDIEKLDDGYLLEVKTKGSKVKKAYSEKEGNLFREDLKDYVKNW